MFPFFDIFNIVLDLFNAKSDKKRSDKIEYLLKTMVKEKKKTDRMILINTICLSLVFASNIIIIILVLVKS